MGDKTNIEWTDATWNPIIGCSRVGPGCDHCYAIGVVHREMSPQHVGLTVKPEGERTDWTGEVRPAGERKLTEPLRWTKPRRIFVNSLSDLFHADLPDDEIAKVFAVMALAPQHTFQVLTKRPQRMAGWLLEDFLGETAQRRVQDMITHLTRVWGWKRPVIFDPRMANPDASTPRGRLADDPNYDRRVPLTWPLPNVHLGVSIENDTYSWRANWLRDTPAAVRFISAEPLLGPLPSLDLTGIDWLIVGGESGPGSRPMHPDWVRDLRDRSGRQPIVRVGGDYPNHDDKATYGPAFLFKQWGDWAQAGRGIGMARSSEGREVLVGEPDDDGCQTVLRRIGKKAAGRELDGRTWDEYPKVVAADA